MHIYKNFFLLHEYSDILSTCLQNWATPNNKICYTSCTIYAFLYPFLGMLLYVSFTVYAFPYAFLYPSLYILFYKSFPCIISYISFPPIHTLSYMVPYLLYPVCFPILRCFLSAFLQAFSLYVILLMHNFLRILSLCFPIHTMSLVCFYVCSPASYVLSPMCCLICFTIFLVFTTCFSLLQVLSPL